MPSLFSRPATRFTAGVMLAVWLMALGMGIANACLVNDDHARHGHLSHETDTFAAAPAGVHDGAVVNQYTTGSPIDSADGAPSSEKMNCQNFCAAGQSSVLKQQGDVQGMPMAARIPATSWWLAQPSPYRHVLWSVRDDLAGSHPPVCIGFLRLTL